MLKVRETETERGEIILVDGKDSEQAKMRAVPEETAHNF